MKHVCLVFGGNGSEAEVSRTSAKGILQALKELGFRVTELEFCENFISNIQKIKPDVVYNSMHGRHGEDGVLPTILNFLRIPYTHSGKNASILGMNKEFCKQIAKSLHIPVLKSHIVLKEQLLDGSFMEFAFEKSFIKPCSEGSTVGCVKFEKSKGLSLEDKKIIENVKDNFFLIEELFIGTELTIGVLGGEAIGGVEIAPKSGYYDYSSKYTKGMTEYFSPPRISPKLFTALKESAVKMHKAIGAAAVSRSDFLAQGEDFKFLEINTHPGFTPLSLVPQMALAQGISFNELVKFLVENAKFEAY